VPPMRSVRWSTSAAPPNARCQPIRDHDAAGRSGLRSASEEAAGDRLHAEHVEELLGHPTPLRPVPACPRRRRRAVSRHTAYVRRRRCAPSPRSRRMGARGRTRAPRCRHRDDDRVRVRIGQRGQQHRETALKIATVPPMPMASVSIATTA
jgi:hypothetical protein